MLSFTGIHRFLYLFLVLLVIMTGNTSCKTKKLISENKIPLSPDSIVSEFLHQKDIEWFNAKAKVIFDDGYNRQKANVFIRYKRDSMIWMVIKKLGVEGARIQISPDSITIIHRLSKEYETASVKYLEQRYGIQSNFDYIQKMVAGIPPVNDTLKPYQEEIISSDHLSIYTIIHDFEHNFIFDLFSGFNTEGNFKNGRSLEGHWKYDDFRTVSKNLNIPFFRQFNVKLNGNESIILTMEFSSVDLNTEKPIRFNVPSHYKKIG